MKGAGGRAWLRASTLALGLFDPRSAWGGEPSAPPPLAGPLRPLGALGSAAYELGSSFGAALEHEQLVSRVGALLSGEAKGFVLFPTLWVETRRLPSVGARLFAAGEWLQAMARVGLGGPRDHVLETRVRVVRARALPLRGGLEALFDSRSGLEHRGLGRDPREDPRNHFLGGESVGVYVSRRSRLLGTLSYAPKPALELALGGALQQTHLDEDPSLPARSLSRVFRADDLEPSLGRRASLYGELALRLDTRRNRGLPSPGTLAEVYAGNSLGLDAASVGFGQAGGRVALFVELGRPHHLVSPRLSVDMLLPSGRLPLDEYVGPNELRSAWTHRDLVAVSSSLDYARPLWRSLRARAFLELSAVAPRLLSEELRQPRLGGGLGLSLIGRSAELGRLDLAWSVEGMRLLLSLGLERGFGDRLHRD